MESKTDQRRLIHLISRNTIKLILAGAIIGIFHQYDHLVAGFLMIYLIYTLARKIKDNDDEKWIYLIGVSLTSILGVACENWGISNQYWSYHNLDNNREFPYWLPIAWALAFTYIYRIEKEIILIKNIQSIPSKILLALIISMIFPTIGEMVVINFGAWTYHWPLQFLGVPLLAVILLMIFHTGINFMLMAICKQLKIKDVVFTLK
ncbi:MAG: hypothetical protein WD426_00220 [Anditalea sp.]